MKFYNKSSALDLSSFQEIQPTLLLLAWTENNVQENILDRIYQSFLCQYYSCSKSMHQPPKYIIIIIIIIITSIFIIILIYCVKSSCIYRNIL